MFDWLLNLPVLQELFGTDPAGLQTFYSVLIGVAVFILALALYFVASGTWNPLRRRVESVKQVPGMPAPKESSPGLIAALGGIFMPRSASKRGSTQEILRYAGYNEDGTIRVFYGLKLLATLLVPTVLFATLKLTGRTMALEDLLLYLLLAGLLGYLIPDLILRRRAQRRQDRLRKGLPDAMDLLVVCSEAGLGLSAGIQRVSSEITITHPDLAEELSLFSMQTRAGMDNRAALRDLEERTGLEDIQTLVAMLLQSMRFGTSIAETLRIYADELRDKRLQRAQEKAARVGTLMIFPLVLCIMPSFLLVVLGPAILGAIRAFKASVLGDFGN
ncbi:type II secretion system F family protein [Thiorhodococcus minor]|uniref:Type II secretion system F family protein n=1 Tax=Thiorhodococcus minor TaxID=57489 RepID=A0A6M0JZR4_9GAMM|nr:type II secretion system F family protein [Thiorhodococcus minor]NEV63028.1 type II secretion system F family protein [Thiorhodococcus minor]